MNDENYDVDENNKKLSLKNTASFAIFDQVSSQFELSIIFITTTKPNESQNLLIEDIIKKSESTSSKEVQKALKYAKEMGWFDTIFKPSFHEDFFGQIVYCKLIDNTLCYFKDILSEVAKKEPRVLMSKNSQETYQTILSFQKMEDLIKYLSNKKITELFYASFQDIKDFFEKKLKIKLFQSNVDVNEADFNMWIKKRNLIVHNRGKISESFVEEFEDTEYQIGDELKFKYKDLLEINRKLINFITEIDILLREKYDLNVFPSEYGKTMHNMV